MTASGGVEGVKSAFAANVVEFAPADKGGGDDGSGPRELPKGCPVTPLGVGPDGYHLLDSLNQYVYVEDTKLGRLKLLKLFGGADYLCDTWPKRNKEGAVVGWRHEAVGEDLIAAAVDKKIWNPTNHLRGRGGWVGDNGGLVFHCGTTIHVGADRRPPGAVGEFVYPAQERIPEPSLRVQKFGADGPAAKLLKLLNTWNWRRGETDAMLLLGWIGAAMLGAALKWRPLVWVTGDKGTGKSTLHEEVFEYLFSGAIVKTANTTAAGIYQEIGFSSLPIAIDELEAKADNARAQAVIELARQAASGTVMLRGGSEHKGVQFMARSCFMFSSILIPPLSGQDISRMAILELGELAKDATLKINREELRETGRALKRALLTNWERFGDTFEAYRMALARAGHDGRGCDQFGALLACADVLLHDHMPDTDTLDHWADRLKRDTLAEAQDLVANHQRCIEWLRSTPVDAWRGGARKSLGQWVRDAYSGHDDAKNVLAQYGVRLDHPSKDMHFVVVANSHRGTSALFEGSDWGTRPGATGVWRQALMRVPGACAWRGRIDGSITRGVAIPLDLVAADNREETGALL